MENKNYRKNLGIPICAFYGIISLASIYQLISNHYGFHNPIFSPLIWIFQDIICSVSMCFIAFKKTIQPNKLGRTGSIILGLLYFIFAVNISLSYADINFTTHLGKYFGIILGVIELIAATLLFYSLKSWMLIKISAVLYWVSCLCAAVYIFKVNMAYEMAKKNSDWPLFERLWSAYQTCEIIAVALSVITVIITTIWIIKSPTVQKTKSNSIDII